MLLAPLPDTARLWVFVSDAVLTPGEARKLEAHLDRFLQRWTSHGRAVPAASAVLHDRFLVVGAHIEDGSTNAGVSGCGIDSLMHAVEEAGAQVGVSWMDGLHVAYEDAAGAVRIVPRSAFRALATSGQVDGTTAVFVTTLDTVGALRSDGLRRAASESWHGRTFRLGAAV